MTKPVLLSPAWQVYQHSMAEADLLIIISGSQVFVREVKTVFLVGQECPKIEVPPPTSKTAMQFQKDFLLVRQHTADPLPIAGITEYH